MAPLRETDLLLSPLRIDCDYKLNFIPVFFRQMTSHEFDRDDQKSLYYRLREHAPTTVPPERGEITKPSRTISVAKHSKKCLRFISRSHFPYRCRRGRHFPPSSGEAGRVVALEPAHPQRQLEVGEGDAQHGVRDEGQLLRRVCNRGRVEEGRTSY